MIKRVLVTGAAIYALSASAALADVTIISSPPYPPNPDENVLLTTGVSAPTVAGETNQTHTAVIFTGQENLVAPPNGQARIQAVDGGLNYLSFQLTNAALGFTAVEFNLIAAATGAVTLSFLDNQGQTYSGTYNVSGNGSNFFDAVATNNQLITRVTIASQTPLSSVAQIRLGGVGPLTSAVPEPATWATMILGMFGIGAMMRRRRQVKLGGLSY